MTTKIMNIDNVETQPYPPRMKPEGPAAERFDARIGFIGTAMGAQKLGYNLTEVAPGKRAFPFHNHRVNEEMFFVLSGEGEIRIGQDTHPIRRGDIVACPPGGPDSAHQIINTGTEVLKFLAVSTRHSPELVEYPDSGKFAILAELAGEDNREQMFRFVGRKDMELDYWEGE